MSGKAALACAPAEGAAAAPGLPEKALAERWEAGVGGLLRLEDGRALRVVFPGTATGASGPDFRSAILDIEGDLVRGDVEIHCRTTGWRQHGHAANGAYAAVVLHVVERHDEQRAFTVHRSGRLIPVLVLTHDPGPGFPPAFTPPCALAVAQGAAPAVALERMGLRRLRAKAARAERVVAAHGAGQALYGAMLETLGGSANREAFAELARRLPLAVLLESYVGEGVPRSFAITAALKGAAGPAGMRRTGARPLASPERRLDSAGALVARWWREGAGPGWPDCLTGGDAWKAAVAPGIGRGMAIELAINAILPVGLASGAISETSAEAEWRALPSPGTYGQLRRLESWLGGAGARPFAGASRLQGGLLLQREYCSRGECGRCPLSAARGPGG